MERKAAIILVVIGFIVWLVGWLVAQKLNHFFVTTMWNYGGSAYQLVTGYYILQPVGILILVVGALLLGKLASRQEKKDRPEQQDI